MVHATMIVDGYGEVHGILGSREFSGRKAGSEAMKSAR